MAVRAETQIDLARVDDGTPGVSPTATVTKTGDTATITITDVNQTTTASVSDGTNGTNGISVTSVEPQYYLSTSDSSATGGTWSSTPAAFVSSRYYWTRDYITFSDGTHDTSTEVYNSGMTKAAQDAYDAKTLADDTNQYFWYAPTGADTGAHITEVPQDEWNDISDPNYHSGSNLLARSNGIAMRDGMTELATFEYGSVGAGGGSQQGTRIGSSSVIGIYPNGNQGDYDGLTVFNFGDMPFVNFGGANRFTASPTASFGSTNADISLTSNTITQVPLDTMLAQRNNYVTLTDTLMTTDGGSVLFDGFEPVAVEVSASAYVIPSSSTGVMVHIFLYHYDAATHTTSEVAAAGSFINTVGSAVQLTPRIITPVYMDDKIYMSVRVRGATGTLYCNNKDTFMTVKYL